VVTIEIEKTDILQVSDKQEQLFKVWLGRYKNLIYKVVNTYTTAPEDQNDLFQEVLLQLWSSIPSFQGDAKETTWIYRVALNTALVWKRTETRKRKKFRTIILDAQGIPRDNNNYYELLRNKQVLDQLHGSIRQLSKSECSIVLLYLDGLSYEEMADVLGITKSNVGVTLNRAKKKLAQLLKGLIDDF
jgi:RNA polymerase sigma-70 factor (ECF subfamily)